MKKVKKQQEEVVKKVLDEEWKIGYSMLPNLRFKEILGTLVFNATYLVESCEVKNFSIDLYKKYREPYIDIYAVENGLTPANMFLEQDGDILIHNSLALDFASYVIPEIGVYFMERSKEMLMNGFVASDAYIVSSVKMRFPKESIGQIFQ